MKKTLTVNLGGTVFHIDEDAYQLLDKYLSNLRIHFRKEEGSEEIMNDFEMRISELFGERVRLGHEVITIEHVEEVINRMGKPEEIFEEETEEEKENAEKAIFELGGTVCGSVTEQLPLSDIQRRFILIDKKRRTPNKYPRKAGVPSKKPIM